MQPRTRRILLTLLIFVLAILFYGVFGRNTLLLSLGDETVTLSGPEKSSFSVPFSSIASMELRESFSPGTAVDGGVKNRIRYGLWHNDEWGNYQLFTSEKIEPVIVLRTTDGDVLVYNYESEKTTRSHYETFSVFLSEQAYAVS